MMKLVEVKRQ